MNSNDLSLTAILDLDLILIKENRLIAECLHILENKLIQLDLPHLDDLLNLREQFQQDSAEYYKYSRRRVNLILYLNSQMIDRTGRCAARGGWPSRNFEKFFRYLIEYDCKTRCEDTISKEEQDAKSKLIELTNELELYEQQMLKQTTRKLSASLSMLHQTDQVEFKKLANDLDRCVVAYLESKQQSSSFIDVIITNWKQMNAFLTLSIRLLNICSDNLRKNIDQNRCLKKMAAKGKALEELYVRKASNDDCSELLNEFESLNNEAKKMEDEQMSGERRLKELNDEFDQQCMSYLDRSERHRQITKSFIVEKRLSKQIKMLLFRMAKLVDIDFKVNYDALDENAFFDNEINQWLLDDILYALGRFSLERELTERIAEDKRTARVEHNELEHEETDRRKIDESNGDQSNCDQSNGDQSNGDQSNCDQSNGDQISNDDEIVNVIHTNVG